MSRVIRGLGAFVTLAALLVGVPVVLARFVGRPWPQPFPTVDTIWKSIQSGDISDTTVIKALAVLIWVAWVRLAISVLVEIVCRMAGSGAPRVVGLGSAQAWAAGLIAAVALLVGAAPRGAAASGSAEPRPIAMALLRTDPVRPANAAPAGFEFAMESAPVGSAARSRSTVSTTTHLVQRHESFWSIAEDELGDGARWREIIDLNRGVEVAPGVVFDGTANRLLPGWVLSVPSSGQAPSGSIAPEPATADSSVVAAIPPIPTSAAGLAQDPTLVAPQVYIEPASVPASEIRTVRVEPGDTLSEIAEDQLGTAAAWPQLWEANRGRDFGERVFDDPNLILVGWDLVVPSMFAPPAPPPSTPATDVPVVVPTDATPPPGPVADAPGAVVPVADVPATQAPVPDVPVAEVPVVEVPVVEVPVAEVPVAEVPVVQPPPGEGSVVETPPEVPETEAPVAEAPSTGYPAGQSPVAEAAPPDVESASSRSDPTDQAEKAPIGGLGAAVLVSSGVIAAVVSRRRRQLRTASVFARLSHPSAGAAATETVLRSLGEGERIARLDIALRAAAAELIAIAPGAAVLGAIVSADGRIDLLLTVGTPTAPEPWVSVTDHCWRLAAATTLDRLAPAARRSNQPCPAIAHIGCTPIGDAGLTGELFIDLEAAGLLTLEGEPARASDVLRAIATGVAVSPMSETAHLIASGLGDVLLGHPLSSEADSLDMALDLAATAIGTTAVTTTATLNTFTLRARHQGGEAWEPAIVFATGADTGGATDSELVSLTSAGGRGLAVVVDRAVHGAAWRLAEQPHAWILHPLGLDVSPVGLTAGDLECVRVLLAEADRPPLLDAGPEQASATLQFGQERAESGRRGPDRIRSEHPSGDAAPPVRSAGLAPWKESDWSLLVRMLGPVEVTDRNLSRVEFERSKALELVVWLSQHRERSTRIGARTALWELDVRDATFANVVSDARRALARKVAPINDEEWIGRTLTEQLPLHPGVTTDAELLVGRLDHARNQSAADAIATLRPGLELIRDIPFGGSSYLWPDAEGITSQLTLTVTSAATLLAGHYLAAGDTDGVFWATGQGLKVLAGHEELIAFRMRAHARHGDLAGVRQEWESYERALNADPWSGGDPAPKLVALRRELLSSSMLVS